MSTLNAPPILIYGPTHGGGAAHTPLANKADGTPAVFADAAARDAYYGSGGAGENLIDDGTKLARGREMVAVGDEANGYAFYTRNAANDAWVPTPANLRGARGEKGDKGDTGAAGALQTSHLLEGDGIDISVSGSDATFSIDTTKVDLALTGHLLQFEIDGTKYGSGVDLTSYAGGGSGGGGGAALTAQSIVDLIDNTVGNVDANVTSGGKVRYVADLDALFNNMTVAQYNDDALVWMHTVDAHSTPYPDQSFRLIAGTDISMTADSQNKSITIAYTGSGGGGGAFTPTQQNIYNAVKAILQSGAGATVVANDGASTLTLGAPTTAPPATTTTLTHGLNATKSSSANTERTIAIGTPIDLGNLTFTNGAYYMWVPSTYNLTIEQSVTASQWVDITSSWVKSTVGGDHLYAITGAAVGAHLHLRVTASEA